MNSDRRKELARKLEQYFNHSRRVDDPDPVTYYRPDGSECSRSEWFARGGWCDWQHNPPPYGVLIQITRDYVAFDTIMAEDLAPGICVRGLKWRMTGIGKETPETRLRLTEQDREWLRGMQVSA